MEANILSGAISTFFHISSLWPRCFTWRIKSDLITVLKSPISAVSTDLVGSPTLSQDKR